MRATFLCLSLYALLFLAPINLRIPRLESRNPESFYLVTQISLCGTITPIYFFLTTISDAYIHR